VKPTKADTLKRVFVIDDDMDVLTVLEILLTMEGFLVNTHFSNNELHERIGLFKPSVILLDSDLGSHKGISICTDIKKKFKDQKIRIIIASNDPEEKQSALKHADGFLIKPFNIIKLVKKINSLLK